MATGDVTLTYTATATVTYPASHYPPGSTGQQIVDQEYAQGEKIENLINLLQERDQLGAVTSINVAVSIA